MSRTPLQDAIRCLRCALRVEVCLCPALRRWPVATRVVVLMHAKELLKPTNTGRLVPFLLEGAEVRLRGAIGAPLQLADLLARPERLLLLDPDGPEVLGPTPPGEPAPTLLVPDGTWRQARRTLSRERRLGCLRRVRLPAGAPSAYRLRDPMAPDRLATLEAIARALGVLEGPDVQEHLERVFALHVERTLRVRGKLHLLSSSGAERAAGSRDPVAPAPARGS